MDETTRPPHRWVADKIGFSVAGVSLLRSGERLPSFSAMSAIRSAFDWGLSEQIDARLDDNTSWAEQFEAKITEKYQAERALETES